MENAIIILCIVCAVAAFLTERNMHNPAFLLSVLFGFMMILSSMRLYGLYAISQRSLNIIFIGVLSLNIGFYASRFVKKNLRIRKQSVGRISVQPMTLNNERDIGGVDLNSWGIRAIQFLAIVACVYIGLKAVNCISLLLSGMTMAQIRNTVVEGYATDNPIFHGMLDYLLLVYIMQLFHRIGMTVGVAIFFMTNGKQRKLLYISAVTCLFMVFTNGGRFIILTFLVELLGGFLICRKRKGRQLSPKVKRIIAASVLAGVAVVLIFTSMRKGSASLEFIRREIYVYFGYVFPFMDYHITNYAGEFTYGVTFLFGLLDFPVFVLHNVFGMDYPSAYSATRVLDGLVQQTQVVGANWLGMNAFTTMFFYFFVNGGETAVCICAFIYSFFISGLYFDAKRSLNLRTVVLYCIALVSVFMSFVRYQFGTHTLVYELLAVQLLFRKDGSARFALRLGHKSAGGAK